MIEPIIMLVCGLLLHYIKDMKRIHSETGDLVTPRQYWTKYPYHTLTCIIGAVVGFIFLSELGEITSINAFMAGYMANSVADWAGKRSTVITGGK